MPNRNNEDSFDYVIVGAGTAGCVLANRLSEDRANRVCLIEAGPKDTHPFIHVPALVAAAMVKPSIVWGYWTVPQQNLNGRKVPIPRGRVIGGTSSINGMVYMRGNPKDYDDWAAAGNRGWSYSEVLPYFVRSENNEAFDGSPYHGKGGPMNVKSIKRPNRLNNAFWEAMKSLQFRRNDDFNGPDNEGYGLRQGTIRGGYRESEATAYLKPAMGRSNLKVLTEALVTRIVMENRRATGVEFQQRRRNTTRRRATRDHCGRRQHRIASDSDALGHRRWRRVAGSGNFSNPSFTRRRCESSRSCRELGADGHFEFHFLRHFAEGAAARSVEHLPIFAAAPRTVLQQCLRIECILENHRRARPAQHTGGFSAGTPQPIDIPAAAWTWLCNQRGSPVPEEPRSRRAIESRSARGPDHRSKYPERARRLRAALVGPQARTPHFRNACVCALQGDGVSARTEGRRRRCLQGISTRDHRDGLSSGRNLPHGC